MKLTIQKDILLRGVNTVLKAVPSKTTMPILECILLTARDHEIILTANDMELGIVTTVEGDIIEPGVIALEAKIFSEIVRRLPDNQVTIETNQQYNTSIVCEKANFTIQGREGDEFVALPVIEKNNYVSMSQFTLKEIIRQTIFSIADNDNNKMMAGELIEINQDTLRIVSLDGHRISIRKVILKDSYDPVKVVVPGKTLSEISKILTGDNDKEVLIYFTRNHVLFEFDQTIVISRLIEGEYFHIDQMLSADYETSVHVNKQELLSCIDRATLLVKESDKKPIILDVTDGQIKIKLVSSLGSLNEDITVEKNGKDIMIGFNPKYLIDALKVIDDETVSLYMVNSKAPCFIKNEEESYIYLIVPVTFNVQA